MALASVIKTFVKRHDGKKIVLKRGEFEVEASGSSQSEVEKFLEKRVVEQKALDMETRRLMAFPDQEE